MACLLELGKNGFPDDTSNMKRFLRDSGVEFLATCLFVYCGTGGAVSTGSKMVLENGASADVARILPIAMCFGVTIMFLAYSIGHITGGHMNPGVSFLMMLRGQMSPVKMLMYWVCQLAGALLGSALVWGSISGLQGEVIIWSQGVTPTPPFALGSNTLSPMLTVGNGFLLEFMGSFIFYFVIAMTALDKRGIAATAFPAIPIGFSLVIVHICLIPFTGCGVNPARTFGPSMMTCFAGDCKTAVFPESYWIYYVAPLLAAIGVAEVTTWLNMDVEEDKESSSTKTLDDHPFKTLDTMEQAVPIVDASEKAAA